MDTGHGGHGGQSGQRLGAPFQGSILMDRGAKSFATGPRTGTSGSEALFVLPLRPPPSGDLVSTWTAYYRTLHSCGVVSEDTPLVVFFFLILIDSDQLSRSLPLA